MINYGYEYFCGANVVVQLNDTPLLECAGLRYSIMESKRPLYGYSSRKFDAVAAGQILVEGSLLVNYVDQHYIMRAISQAASDSIGPTILQGDDLLDAIKDDQNASLALSEYANDPIKNSDVASALVRRYWESPTDSYNPFSSAVGSAVTYQNPHWMLSGSVNIKVTFGDREAYGSGDGITHYVLNAVNFTGRSQVIEISENVIVEEYPFFARDVVSIAKRYTQVYDRLKEETTLTEVSGLNSNSR
jgi:hypothetical protein